jgi:sialic acid synthase SpsE
MADELSGMRATFMRSLALREDLPMGTVLARHHLTAKKPATGIPPANLDAIVGRALRRDVSARNLLRLEDLE